MYDMVNLNTLVHHVCEKTGDIHIPDVAAVYAQIIAANDGKYANILLLPEYNGNEVFADLLAWLTDNFGGPTGIPIMLTVFEGGPYADHVVTQLTANQILQVMAVANVKWLRFFEVKSWYLAHSQTFPTAYVATILAFCRTNNLKVFWTEYKVDHVFQDIQGYIAGFEDIVTVGFSTNSGELEPWDGFNLVKGLFTHWGGSVQSWYWETRHRLPELAAVNDPQNMPVSWLIRHACLCRNIGAEVIQFEPYEYFFGKIDGKASQSLAFLHYYLNSAMSAMQGSTVILQTLMGEWQYGPDKTDIFWSNNPIEFAFGAQPPAPDFFKMKEKNAVFCYSLGSSSLTRKLWLKLEDVAVQVVAKAADTAIGDNVLRRESLKAEVERIIHMYDVLAPLWNTEYTYANGSPCRRRIPGIGDVVISAEQSQGEDFNLARTLIQVKCKFYPRSIVTSQV
jgi:hypothetical protein